MGKSKGLHVSSCATVKEEGLLMRIVVQQKAFWRNRPMIWWRYEHVVVGEFVVSLRDLVRDRDPP